MATISPSDKIKKHDVLKRLKYQSGTPQARYIDPGAEQVPFDHLSDADYLLLRKKRVIAVAATSKTAKDGDK